MLSADGLAVADAAFEFSESFNSEKEVRSAIEVFEGEDAFEGMQGDVGLAEMDVFASSETIHVEEDQSLEVADLELETGKAESAEDVPLPVSEEVLLPEVDPVEQVDPEDESSILGVIEQGSVGVDLGVATSVGATSRNSDKDKKGLRIVSGREDNPADESLVGDFEEESLVIAEGETLKGEGELDVHLINNGIIAPGNSPGIQEVDNLTQGSAGVIFEFLPPLRW